MLPSAYVTEVEFITSALSSNTFNKLFISVSVLAPSSLMKSSLFDKNSFFILAMELAGPSRLMLVPLAKTGVVKITSPGIAPISTINSSNSGYSCNTLASSLIKTFSPFFIFVHKSRIRENLFTVLNFLLFVSKYLSILNSVKSLLIKVVYKFSSVNSTCEKSVLSETTICSSNITVGRLAFLTDKISETIPLYLDSLLVKTLSGNDTRLELSINSSVSCSITFLICSSSLVPDNPGNFLNLLIAPIFER